MDKVLEEGPETKESLRQIGEVDESFYLIGVGASAGGLDAIKQLLSQVQPGFRHSLVIVQHISPDYKSLMSEILGRETSLPVAEVTDNMEVEAGRIYLIPPRSNIVIQGTKDDNAAKLENGESYSGLRFSLIEQTPRPGLNLPIDVFFHSLSEAVRDRAIAVILSGSGSDGSRGLRSVKDREGFVMVQDPSIAAFDGMPRSAIATGIVDAVLPPDSMIGEINRYLEMRERGIDNVDNIFSDARDEFDTLLSLVSEKAELDFSLYKEPTLKRRVARRMALRGYNSLSEYLPVLKTDSTELNVLCREFLVGVTNFFRDYPVWQNLKEHVLPKLFEDGHDEIPVRVWTAGCSTGEEAYTVAMLMEAYRAEHGITRDFRVFATDVNEDAINAAKQAVYPDSVQEEIPEEYLEAGYLIQQAGTFRIAPAIRNRIVFSVHDVIENAPFTRTDLIICRNLLIYISPEVQAKILTHFSFSLRKDGVLQLGAAETPGVHGQMFEALNHKTRTYRNTRMTNLSLQRQRLSLQFQTGSILPRNRRMSGRGQHPEGDVSSLLSAFLQSNESCICITDESTKVIRTFGDHENFLHIPTSGFSANLLDLVDERLRSSVALLLRRAESEGKSEKKGARLIRDDVVDVIEISCRKIPWEAHVVAYAVTFRRRSETVPSVEEGTQKTSSEESNLPTAAYIEHLEGEVQSLQDMLSATAEDLGASNEELQTTNEELIASNEELQANNEETQSINEELHTLNAENAEKISELESATGDINNLLETAGLGVLVLDNDLHIRQFSKGISHYISLEMADIGRPLANFALKFEAESLIRLMDDIRLSRDNGEEHKRELRARDGGFVFCHTRPYRNVHGDQNGVVVNLQDITATKLLEQEVRQQRDRLEALLEGEAAGYWDWNIPANELFMSKRFKMMFGYEDDEIENTPDGRAKIIHPDDAEMVDNTFAAHINSRGKIPFDLETRYLHKDGSVIWVLSLGSVVEWGEDGKPQRMMGVHIDISEIKARELAVQRRAEEVRRFAFVAAHDLVQPMNTIENSITMLSEDMPAKVVDENEEVFEFLTSSSQRMKERINGILEFSRLDDEEFDFATVDLNLVVQECLEDLADQVDKAGAKIKVSKNLPKTLGSTNMILRVVQNIVSNALIYRHKDRDCLVKIEKVRAPKGKVAIKISDNGIGIPSKYRRKVFELFNRLHTDEEFSGTGLGLSLAERIISRLGGEIKISDGTDGGTAFTLMLQSAKK